MKTLIKLVVLIPLFLLLLGCEEEKATIACYAPVGETYLPISIYCDGELQGEITEVTPYTGDVPSKDASTLLVFEVTPGEHSLVASAIDPDDTTNSKGNFEIFTLHYDDDFVEGGYYHLECSF